MFKSRDRKDTITIQTEHLKRKTHELKITPNGINRLDTAEA